MYYIETYYKVGMGGQWERLPDDAGSTTEEEAEETIEQLRTLGDDWSTAKYRIVEEEEEEEEADDEE